MIRLLHACIPTLALGLLLPTGTSRAGGLPYLVGTEGTVEATAQAFASPALPSLGDDGARLTPMIGIVTVKGVDDSGDLPSGTNSTVYSGKVTGRIGSIHLQYSRKKSDFGYFVLAAGSKISGEMESEVNGATDTIRDISASGYIGSVGMSYRLIGDEKSRFAMGLFGGPAFMSLSATQEVVSAEDEKSEISFDSAFYGPYLGAQLLWRLGKLRINPYFSGFQDLSDHCRNDIQVSGAESFTSICENGKKGYGMDSSLFGFGLNLGYAGLGLNVYSRGMGRHRYLQGTSYALSYGIGF